MELSIIINEEDPQTTATFTIPEGTLTEHSDFFKAACRDASPATARVVKLPQVDHETFGAYLFWIQGGTIAFNITSQSVSASDLYPVSLELAKLWLLADRLTTRKLRHDVMVALHRTLLALDHTQGNPAAVFPPSLIMLIWPVTAPGRSLRKMVVDYYATKVPISLVEEHFEEYHPDFVQELTQKIVEIQQNAENNPSTAQVNGHSTTAQVHGDHDHESATDPPRPQDTNLSTAQVNGDHHHEPAAPNSPAPLDEATQRANLPTPPSAVSVILKDKLGNTLHATAALFATPSRFVGAITPKLLNQTPGDEQPSTEVVLQFPGNASYPVGEAEWTKSFNEVSTLAGFSVCPVANSATSDCQPVRPPRCSRHPLRLRVQRWLVP